MRLPNLLATRRGRLVAFFGLYVTEGIPLGFAATAVAAQLRRQDVGPTEIGAFVGSFYLPWAFKWAFGPFIDVFASDRLGRRRGWILITQILMALTLLSTVLLTLPEQLGLFTLILLVHNTFGAAQDVAIDALACNTLREEERGLANGLMFAGAYIGMMLGGGGVLLLVPYTGFQATFFFVAGAILLVTWLIVWPMREPPSPPRPSVMGSKLRSAALEMQKFAVSSFRSFFGTTGAFAGLFFALLPAGAMSLGLALQTNLAVELGLSDSSLGSLSLGSAALAAGGSVLGGYLSDRLGRRKALFTYIALMGLPVLYLMTELTRAGWIMPVPLDLPDRPAVPMWIVHALWAATLVYSFINGLMYGTRSAIFMDVTNPRVAATQFTAYMALMNLTIAYSSTWQGIAIDAWGYPRTMLVDVCVGLLSLAVLPFMRKMPAIGGRFVDGAAAVRARVVAVALALACLAWLPYQHGHEQLGAAQPIANTFFSLVFVMSAVFLLAGGAVLRQSRPVLSRMGACVAPFLLLLGGRSILGAILSWLRVDLDHPTNALFRSSIDGAQWMIPIAGAIFLGWAASSAWTELSSDESDEAASSDNASNQRSLEAVL